MSTKPVGNCASPNPRQIIMELFPNPGEVVGIYITYTWDGVSQYPACDGNISSIRVLNTSTTRSGYVKVPARKTGNKWIDIPPGTDQTISNPGQLNSYGMTKAADADNIGFSLNSDGV